MDAKHVTPRAGVWIEIGSNNLYFIIPSSLPVRECGLKYVKHWRREYYGVTPRAGVWIEISS